MIPGGCHCGRVRYEVHGRIHGFKHCHCVDCRKIHGTVYASSALTEAAGFRIVQGEAELERYESSPGKRRCFCRHCGSHLFAYYERDPSVYILRAGTLDTPPDTRPELHIWVSQKADWYEILDDLPQFPESPPA
jgi:hypothetical protein